ncbi:hypothetical protein [Kordiimonas sp.]|uniref:hypothetical protein n=1 Tax=Kordiimonas sp. TaxID=1970157 RepID=UPI003A939A58
MAHVEVRDHALWLKHIHGDENLKKELESLPAGDLIELVVDGVKGTWKKMSDGRDGRPTMGIRGILSAKAHWHALQEQRGQLVTIERA